MKELIRDGYDLNLTLLGSFREQPVWLGDRRTTTGPAQRCLIVDADGSRQCATLDEALQSGLRVQLLDVDQETGELLSASVVEVAFTRWQMPYLTVTSGPAVVDEATGESYLVTTGPPGIRSASTSLAATRTTDRSQSAAGTRSARIARR